MAMTVKEVLQTALKLTGHIQPAPEMTKTAKEVVDAALQRLGLAINQNGEIDENRAKKYYSIAIPIINELQAEILAIENPVAKAKKITDLSETLSISDNSATRALPIGIACRFSLADKMPDLYNVLAGEYNNALNMVQPLVSGDTTKYIDIAPAICDVLQLELLKCEGKNELPDPITSIDDILSIDDYTARAVLPYALGARLAKIDHDDNTYNNLMSLYKDRKKTIHPRTRIHDVYGTLKDVNMFW